MLRPFRADDFEAALEFAKDQATARWVPALPAADGASIAEVYEEARVAGELLLLVIADRTSDAYLGEVTVVVGEHQVGELGCGLIPAARGRGIASEALRLLGDWAFRALELGRLQVFVALENVAALRLSERAGFRREGVLRAYWQSDGARLDAVVLARLPNDRPSSRS